MSAAFEDRRLFLKTTGFGLALPVLESICANEPESPPNANGSAPAKRFVVIGTYLGFHIPSFFPKQTGKDYVLSPVLKPVEQHRQKFSLFSGLDHRAQNGHSNWKNYLIGAGTTNASLDQTIAAEIGDRTRFASLELTCGGATGNALMSFTPEGVPLPMIGRPSVVFGKLFSSDSDKARMKYILDSSHSVLDVVLDEARTLQRSISTTDQQKLNEYFSSVRDVEKKIQKQRKWLDRPSPKVDYKLPKFDPVAPDVSLECESIMYDLMTLALETDSTRVISLMVPGAGQVFTIDGEKLSAGYHGLSHHGNDPLKIADFNRIGTEHVSRFARLLNQLTIKKDTDGRPLLDSTIVFYGSGMGDANTHNNSRLPVLVAGGGMKHGSHHAIDRSATEAPLLGDLFITLMQQLGIERDRFSNATRNMNEYLLS